MHPIKEVVNEFAKNIRSGKWIKLGFSDPIKFDQDGHMRDGEHRCRAVVAAKKSIMVDMVTGINPSNVYTVDTGRQKSYDSTFQINKKRKI